MPKGKTDKPKNGNIPSIRFKDNLEVYVSR